MKRTLLYLLPLLALLLLALPAVAQDVDGPASGGAQYFASISGIIVMTLVFTSIAKRAAIRVAWAQNVPVWVMAVVIAVGLTAVGHYLLGILKGNPVDLFIRAVEMAAAASGFREWAKKLDVTPNTGPKSATVLAACLLLGGCSATAADRAFLAASQSHYDTVSEDWERYIGGDEELTDLERLRRLNTHKTYGDALEDYAAELDGRSFFLPFLN